MALTPVQEMRSQLAAQRDRMEEQFIEARRVVQTCHEVYGPLQVNMVTPGPLDQRVIDFCEAWSDAEVAAYKQVERTGFGGDRQVAMDAVLTYQEDALGTLVDQVRADDEYRPSSRAIKSLQELSQSLDEPIGDMDLVTDEYREMIEEITPEIEEAEHEIDPVNEPEVKENEVPDTFGSKPAEYLKASVQSRLMNADELTREQLEPISTGVVNMLDLLEHKERMSNLDAALIADAWDAHKETTEVVLDSLGKGRFTSSEDMEVYSEVRAHTTSLNNMMVETFTKMLPDAENISNVGKDAIMRLGEATSDTPGVDIFVHNQFMEEVVSTMEIGEMQRQPMSDKFDAAFPDQPAVNAVLAHYSESLTEAKQNGVKLDTEYALPKISATLSNEEINEQLTTQAEAVIFEHANWRDVNDVDPSMTFADAAVMKQALAVNVKELAVDNEVKLRPETMDALIRADQVYAEEPDDGMPIRAVIGPKMEAYENYKMDKFVEQGEPDKINDMVVQYAEAVRNRAEVSPYALASLSDVARGAKDRDVKLMLPTMDAIMAAEEHTLRRADTMGIQTNRMALPSGAIPETMKAYQDYKLSQVAQKSEPERKPLFDAKSKTDDVELSR